MLTREQCQEMDEADPLKNIVDKFFLESGLIYLSGNSLGAMPLNAPKNSEIVHKEQWAKELNRSWRSAGWFALPETLGDQLGELIGSGPGQTLVCDSTSINIYKALGAAMNMRKGRHIIISEESNFPTDLYMIEGVVAFNAINYSRLLLDTDGENLEQLLNNDVAVVMLSHVNFKTGALLDMKKITEQVHEAGALMIWDLSHSVGVVPINLDNLGVDFAVGCTYKYLNGGPGSPAFIYVAKRHQEIAIQPLTGWWGHADPFSFETRYRPVSGIRRFLCSTQPILSMQSLANSLDIFDGIDMHEIRRKSLQLTKLFIDLTRQNPACRSLDTITPYDDSKRGGQVSFRFDKGYSVIKAMQEKGVYGNFYSPDIMRFGLAPFYLRYTNLFDAVEIMAICIEAEASNSS